MVHEVSEAMSKLHWNVHLYNEMKDESRLLSLVGFKVADVSQSVFVAAPSFHHCPVAKATPQVRELPVVQKGTHSPTTNFTSTITTEGENA